MRVTARIGGKAEAVCLCEPARPVWDSVDCLPDGACGCAKSITIHMHASPATLISMAISHMPVFAGHVHMHRQQVPRTIFQHGSRPASRVGVTPKSLSFTECAHSHLKHQHGTTD